MSHGDRSTDSPINPKRRQPAGLPPSPQITFCSSALSQCSRRTESLSLRLTSLLHRHRLRSAPARLFLTFPSSTQTPLAHSIYCCNSACTVPHATFLCERSLFVYSLFRPETLSLFLLEFIWHFFSYIYSLHIFTEPNKSVAVIIAIRFNFL